MNVEAFGEMMERNLKITRFSNDKNSSRNKTKLN